VRGPASSAPIGFASLGGHSRLMEHLLAYKSIAVGLWLAAFFIAERLNPAAPFPPRAGVSRLMRNAGLAAINLLLSPLIVLPLTAFAAGNALSWRPLWWSGISGLLLDLLLLDFLIYWWHRWNHEWPFLWRFHGVHHLDRFLDSTSALRFHFGEVLLSALARAGVILLIGFPLSSILAFETLVLMATIFHHSDLRLPRGFEAALARLVITPSIHWVHHHRRKADTDSNYGTVFSFWDHLFASTNTTPRQLAMEIGVEGEGEASLPDLILRPLRAVRPPASAS
jgi:sterol desaturase/sphingolipid hydroxylase (fatty acid hydroxylase superfamily)